MKSQKIMLVFDESDCITNPSSKRTKGILNCFRKAKYKICMTGTSTRNNICEIYPQLELLYNNSINMLCESAEKYVISKDDFNKGELVAEANDMYMLPFPPYKRGYKLFSECHLPDKITVFGVAQKTQDIYNSEELKRILDKTVITRSFEEISGKELYEIKQITCRFSPEEKEIYKTAIDEFYKLDYLFKKTGNSRKDSMLKILNQLLLLLKICAAPQTIKEYRGNKITNKFKKVLNLINKYDERIVIGVRHIQNVYAYKEVIQECFPSRPIFIVTGAETTLNQRKEVINQLKETANGILICTQQSLSCSMNIDFVNKCIIPELHWNNSSMSQFYFRFIRFTSTEWKQVYFVTYENSIESNLLKMILSKEKLNLFMKDEDVDDYELYEKFGIDFDIVNMLMTKEKDKDGKVLIRWGDQNIS